MGGSIERSSITCSGVWRSGLPAGHGRNTNACDVIERSPGNSCAPCGRVRPACSSTGVSCTPAEMVQ